MLKKKILLVDDEVDILKIIGLRINSWGYESLKAKNGKEAIKIVQEKKPDLVVLDFMLPDMDGITVIKELRRISKNIPIIMFTAYPNSTTMHETEKLGISAYVAKFSVASDAQSLLKEAIELSFKKISERKEAE